VVRGKLQINSFFGKNGSVAGVISGGGFRNNDLVKLQN
jgi:hypothetical protein